MRNQANKAPREPLILTNLEIIDIAEGGRGIAKADGLVVFVDGTVPGDVVDVWVYKKKKNLVEGRVHVLHSASEDRIEPLCTHFGLCGGCKRQNMTYAKQLFYKQKTVTDALNRLTTTTIPAIKPIIGSPLTTYYRNKMEFTFSSRRWLYAHETELPPEDIRGLGFHIPGKFDKIVDIDHCHLQPTESNDIRKTVRAYALENNYTFYDQREHTGELRNLIIRNTSLNQWMVLLVVSHITEERIESIMAFIHGAFPELTSLMYCVNTKKNDTIYDLDVTAYKGQNYITETLEKVNYKINPKSFFQTNLVQTQTLYAVTRDMAQIQPTDTVYDLYCGTGSITNFVAHQAHTVVGIELVPEAIADAKENSLLNGITNTHFMAGDMRQLFTPELIATFGQPQVIITDPPRAGMHPDVCAQLLAVAAPRIVYVSCNAATQARDIEILSAKYKVLQVQPVDMFPHTDHCENVVLLELI